MAENALREMMQHRKVKLGHLVAEFATPGIGHILKAAGCDYVFFDMEHSGFGMETLKNALRFVPGLGQIHIIRTMGGLRPYTPDGLPLVGYVNRPEGYFMAAGHEGDGIALSPITGKIVADLIVDGRTFMDVSALDPNRFPLGGTC